MEFPDWIQVKEKILYRAVVRLLCLGGGSVPDPKKFSEPRNSAKKFFGLLGAGGGFRGMLLRKIFKGSEIG